MTAEVDQIFQEADPQLVRDYEGTLRSLLLTADGFVGEARRIANGKKIGELTKMAEYLFARKRYQDKLTLIRDQNLDSEASRRFGFGSEGKGIASKLTAALPERLNTEVVGTVFFPGCSWIDAFPHSQIVKSDGVLRFDHYFSVEASSNKTCLPGDCARFLERLCLGSTKSEGNFVELCGELAVDGNGRYSSGTAVNIQAVSDSSDMPMVMRKVTPSGSVELLCGRWTQNRDELLEVRAGALSRGYPSIEVVRGLKVDQGFVDRMTNFATSHQFPNWPSDFVAK